MKKLLAFLSLMFINNVIFSQQFGGIINKYALAGSISARYKSGLDHLAILLKKPSFKTNTDSITIKDSAISCTDFDFKGLSFGNSNPIFLAMELW